MENEMPAGAPAGTQIEPARAEGYASGQAAGLAEAMERDAGASAESNAKIAELEIAAAGDGRTKGMTFSAALCALKLGERVPRAGWNGKNMFLFLVSGSTFEVNREPLLSIMGRGRIVDYQPHIDMLTANGTVVPWLASQSDLLAGDWYILDARETDETITDAAA